MNRPEGYYHQKLDPPEEPPFCDLCFGHHSPDAFCPPVEVEESREERLERALRGLVEELHEYDYVAQVDEDNNYGPETALGWAEKVLCEE